MNHDFSTKFFKENIVERLPDGHVAIFIQRAVGTNDDNHVAGVWHSTVNLECMKIMLESVLNDINKKLKNA